ncbi:hypothetical protein Syun_014095 [Stephania yunnanensis]|uniref:RNase H type-1 domain-containing protein n=1 Tax=Stephania yunnanensis TaxID=152371 RepID=A0AAP0JJG2_9MAGN
MGYRKVILEKDSLAAVTKINNRCVSPNQRWALLLQILKLLDDHWQVQVKHVHMEGNRVADRMASLARQLSIGRGITVASGVGRLFKYGRGERLVERENKEGGRRRGRLSAGEAGDGAQARRRRRRGLAAGAPEQGVVALSSSSHNGTWRRLAWQWYVEAELQTATARRDLRRGGNERKEASGNGKVGQGAEEGEWKEWVSVVELVEVSIASSVKTCGPL